MSDNAAEVEDIMINLRIDVVDTNELILNQYLSLLGLRNWHIIILQHVRSTRLFDIYCFHRLRYGRHGSETDHSRAHVRTDSCESCRWKCLSKKQLGRVHSLPHKDHKSEFRIDEVPKAWFCLGGINAGDKYIHGGGGCPAPHTPRSLRLSRHVTIRLSYSADFLRLGN